MNTPNLPAQSLTCQSQLSKTPGSDEGRGANTTNAVFNARDVTHYDISSFFVGIPLVQIMTLAVDTCNAAEKEYVKQNWKRENLDKALKAYNLPRDFSPRGAIKHRKPSAIFNVFLQVKEEGVKAKQRGGDGHDLPLAHSLCNFLNREKAKEGGNQDPHFVSMDFFVAQMNRHQRTMDITHSVIGSHGPESQHSESGWPTAENPTFTMAGKPSLASGKVKNNIDSLQKQLQFMGEKVLVDQLHDQLHMLERSFSQKKPKLHNHRAIKAIDCQANDLAKQINKLGCTEFEYEKTKLQSQLTALQANISSWLVVVAAFDTLTSLKSYLDGFQFCNSLQDIDLFAKKLDEFERHNRDLPAGEARNTLMRETSILRNSFADIQTSVRQKQLYDALAKAENTIKTLEYGVSGYTKSGNTKSFLVGQAKAALAVARPLIDLGKDDDFAMLGNLCQRLSKLTGLERSGDQEQAIAAEPHPEFLLQRGAAFKKELAAFSKQATASGSGGVAAAGNMSALSGKFAALPTLPGQTISQAAPSQAVLHSSTRQSQLQAKTGPVLTHGERLTSFASELKGCRKLKFWGDGSISASLGIRTSSEKIKCFVTWCDIPLETLPSCFRERMIEANNDSNIRPKDVIVLQVYAFAPNESDFNGAGFTVELESLLTGYEYRIFNNSRDGRNYSPLGANLRMPEGLRQGNRFYEARWDLNQNLAERDTVRFAHGSGVDNHSSLEDIGFTLAAPVPPGASAQEAAFAEPGFGIPFGIDMRAQPESVIRELENQNMHGVSLDYNVGAAGSSGINPVATQEGSTCLQASEILTKEVGILWVKRVTALADINSARDLLHWLRDDKFDPKNPRFPQLL
ncbi:hypothetical protein [Endozoicomonas sp. ONNA2]|uniref:hypothetical protein n=1 Tax=Endozoicomonas sp. ONNA2 TaxID=2828741 RepID=UPI002147BBE4|nr:hypothetical protein [Endozoicomonas sp. ONNA2]